MTIYELSQQLHSISLNGYFNGEKRSVKWLRAYIQSMFRAGGNSLIMEISMQDGRWLFEICRWSECGGFQYDYCIPDTRAQEERLYKKLGVTPPAAPVSAP